MYLDAVMKTRLYILAQRDYLSLPDIGVYAPWVHRMSVHMSVFVNAVICSFFHYELSITPDDTCTAVVCKLLQSLFYLRFANFWIAPYYDIDSAPTKYV